MNESTVKLRKRIVRRSAAGPLPGSRRGIRAGLPRWGAIFMAALLLAGSPAAPRAGTPAEDDDTAFSFIQISDIHFTGADQDIRERLAQVGHIASETGAAFILITGDLQPRNWSVLSDVLHEFPVPFYPVMGNHDLEAGIDASLANFRQYFGPDDYAFVYHNTEFIGLNSEALQGLCGAKEGEAQWARFADRVSAAHAARRNHVIMFGHEPLYRESLTEPATEYNFTPAARQRFFSVAQAGPADLYLAGHLHQDWTFNLQPPLTYVCDSLRESWGTGIGYAYIRVQKDSISRTYVRLEVPDTLPPMMPLPLTISAPTSTTRQLEWLAALDNTAVAYYDIIQDDTRIGRAYGESFKLPPASQTGDHTFTVVARDLAGNASTPGVFETTSIVAGPWLENLTDSGVTIRWKTGRPTQTSIGLLRDGAQSDESYWPDLSPTTDHSMVLQGLRQRTAYSFTIRTYLQDLATGPDCRFVTRSQGERNAADADAWPRYD